MFQDVIAGLYARIDPQPPGRAPSVWMVREKLRQAVLRQPSTTRLYAWISREKPVLIPITRFLDLLDVAALVGAERTALIVAWAEEAHRMEREEVSDA